METFGDSRITLLSTRPSPSVVKSSGLTNRVGFALFLLVIELLSGIEGHCLPLPR